MKKILIVNLLLIFVGLAVAAEDLQILQIHMPRQIKVDTVTPNLGQIAVLNGSGKMVAIASKIPMGRVALAEQKIIIDRPTVLSRLASNGFASSDVKLTGAESISVSLDNTTIDSQDFLTAARDYVETIAADKGISSFTVSRYPESLLLAEQRDDIKLVATTERFMRPNILKVAVKAFIGKENIGTRKVEFRLKYKIRQAIATADIFKGTVLNSSNIRIETVDSNKRQLGWSAPFGQIAKTDIAAGSVIREDAFTNPHPEVIVKRNQTVVIKIDYSALTVTAIGVAKQDGVIGDLIKVQNADSKRIILAKIAEDGSVKPIF